MSGCRLSKVTPRQIEQNPLLAKYAASVLFIDDEPATVNLVTIMMTKLGYNIRAENSPVEALKFFREQPDQFDLVITDLTMPEMTGIQLSSEIHKIAPSIPVILMTGYGKMIDHDMPLRHYGINHLLKTAQACSLGVGCQRSTLINNQSPHRNMKILSSMTILPSENS